MIILLSKIVLINTKQTMFSHTTQVTAGVLFKIEKFACTFHTFTLGKFVKPVTIILPERRFFSWSHALKCWLILF